MLTFLTANYIEIIATVLGFLFIYLEIKENKWLWFVGLITAILYIYIFFIAKLYADMSLQVFYVVMSIYGWVKWTKSKNLTDTKKEAQLPIVRLNRQLSVKLLIASTLIYALIVYVLVSFTDASLPYWDALTTALGIVATWMLAQKIIEQWLVWVVADAISMCLYVYKGLYPTVILFAVYTVLAVIGYYQWKKAMQSEIIKN